MIGMQIAPARGRLAIGDGCLGGIAGKPYRAIGGRNRADVSVTCGRLNADVLLARAITLPAAIDQVAGSMLVELLDTDDFARARPGIESRASFAHAGRWRRERRVNR